jgi:hypothetical protein
MPRVLFTRETARDMASRSNAIQRERRREGQNLAPLSPPATGDHDAYVTARLTRVREHLDSLDKQLTKAVSRGDAKLIRDLAMASQYLNDQEFALAGRPKPGQRRHPPEVPRRREMPRTIPSLPLQPQTAAAG